MEHSELSIAVGELIGVPRMTLRGALDAWHDEAVSGVLTALRDQPNTSIILDIANLTLASINGATALVEVLRSLGPEVCVHVVASGPASRMLAKAELGPCVRLYSSTDEIAQYLSPVEYPLDSWMSSESEDPEMPLAA